MKQLLTVSLALITLLVGANSGDHSPRLYFNRFHKELTNFQIVSMEYYKTNLLSTDTKTIDNKLKKVVQQLQGSKARIAAAPVYKSDSNLRDTYLAGMDSLLQIFENDFVRIQHLKRYRNLSYAQLIAYNQALDSAEDKTRKVQNHLAQTELVFAGKHGISLKYDSRNDIQYKQFKLVSTHYQKLSSYFSDVDHQVMDYINTIQGQKSTGLNNFGLSQRVEKLSETIYENIEKAKEDIPENIDPALKKELMGYLKAIKNETKSSLKNITNVLESEPYYTNDFKNAKIDLQFFSERYSNTKNSFEQKRIQWLQAAYEEIEKMGLEN